MDTKHLLHLLTLSSSNLPIGAYCYSQGIESAIETGLITNEQSCLDFLADVLELVLIHYELPMLAQFIDSKEANIQQLIHHYMASRETKELLLESEQLAHAFYAWLRDVLFFNDNKTVDEILFTQLPTGMTAKQIGFLPLYGLTCRHLQLSKAEAMTSYGFTQIENQALAAVKTIPLGQMAGQRILLALHAALNDGIQTVLENKVTSSSSLPNLAMLSSRHEMQYSRLFRS